MVATSPFIARVDRGVDFVIGLRYDPPEGDPREGLFITATLIADRNREINASTCTFDYETGEIIALWEEETTRKLISGLSYMARFTRSRDGSSRVFFTKEVEVA